MKIAFCKSTALSLLRAGFPAVMRYAPPLLNGSRPEVIVEMLENEFLAGCPRPLHVRTSRYPTRQDDVVYHTWHPVQAKQLRSVAGLPLIGPELLFVDLAAEIDLVDLLLVGFELCGLYRVQAKAPGFIAAEPLTTPRRLAGHLASLSRTHGAKLARIAAPLILPNAASPMEAALALLLSLPHRHGGMALPRPRLNQALSLGGKHLICDAYWPTAKLALEYDSDQFHAGAEKLHRDAERRVSLMAHGITVISVTREQLKQPAKLDELEKTVRTLLGARRQVRCRDYAKRRDELRRRVLGLNLREGTTSYFIRFGC